MNVVLYTVGCSKCKVLSMKLGNKKIPYEVCTDIEIMKSMGFIQAPMLEVDGKIMNFTEAVEWVNNQ